MKKIVLNVKGMSCSHCENSVKKFVGELNGVNNVDVNLSGKTVTVEFNEDIISLNDIKETIDDIGYQVL